MLNVNTINEDLTTTRVQRNEIMKKKFREICVILMIYFPTIALDLYFYKNNCDSNGNLLTLSEYLLVSGIINLLWTIYTICLIIIYNTQIEIYDLNYTFLIYLIYHTFYMAWIIVGMFVLSNIIQNNCSMVLINYLTFKIISALLYYLLNYIFEIN